MTRRRQSSSRSRRAESSARRCWCRTTPDPRALQHSIVQYIHDAAPQQIIDNVSTLEEIRDATVVPRRLNAMFVASFAGLAFLIAIVGIVGVLASSVRSRTAELGIRMSLGAGPERLRRMVLAEGGVLIGLGIAIGFARIGLHGAAASRSAVRSGAARSNDVCWRRRSCSQVWGSRRVLVRQRERRRWIRRRRSERIE